MKGSKNDSTIVVFEGQIFKGIEELGFDDTGEFILDLWTTDPAEQRGSYFSCLPISPIKYRRKYPTQSGYKLPNSGEIIIYDDWGSPHRINTEQKVIEAIVQECIDNEVPERS